MTNYEWLLEQLKIETDECQEWPHGRHQSGYGKVKVDGKDHRVHRVALQIATGEDGAGLEAAHKPVVCHNRACFNPRHLSWKTHRENHADRVADGTHLQGEANGRTKLTEQQVRRIVRLWETGSFTQIDIGKIFGVSRPLVSNIVNRTRWAHLWE